MFVCLYLCVCKIFCRQRFLRNYCTQDFEIWYKCCICLVVLWKRKSASSGLSFPLFVHFSLPPIKISVIEISAPIIARVFIFCTCMHLERGQVYSGKENQDAVINFCLFPFFLFSISHSDVIHREIWVKDFSGTTAPRILKSGTNVGYDWLHCVKENQYAAAYLSL